MKAENADVWLITRQTFRDYPDYWVTDGSFSDLERVTDANPQQEQSNFLPMPCNLFFRQK